MKQQVWVLIYTHRHGSSVTAYPTEAFAERGCAELCAREATSECTAEIALQIQGHCALGNYAEAIQLYTEHVDHESFETQEVSVEHGEIRGVTCVEQGNDVVHMVKMFPHAGTPGDAWCDRMFFWTSQSVTLPVNTSSFKAYLPKEQRFTTCLSCLGSADGE